MRNAVALLIAAASFFSNAHAANPPLTVSTGFGGPILTGVGQTNFFVNIRNDAAVSATNVSFTANYPPQIMSAAAPAPTSECGGVLTVPPNGSSVSLSGGTIPPHQNCIIFSLATSNVGGEWLVTLPAGAVTSDNVPANVSQATSVMFVKFPAAIVTKTFDTPLVTSGNVVGMTVTFTNPNGAALTQLAFADHYPSGMTNPSTTTPSSSTCGGVLTAPLSTGGLSFSGGTIPANGSCSVHVIVFVGGPNGIRTNFIAGDDVMTRNGWIVATANGSVMVGNQLPAGSTYTYIGLFAALLCVGLIRSLAR